ncbi:hypothetical protein K0T92_14275 [Paenibacillus oenotherae]|uniref:Uncharacterized protein n=1 Tax=Paenibacillus oenotherae TaxID=1435645 RepID=A0ABS7D7H9_9BACL|nr:hypothetical protein [Paenibacillus oenotherae]MBW7475908.1 hypothetical protein [Paenibacillus oenotherae]
MNMKGHLLERLDGIADAVSRRPEGLALLGVGSVGSELNRLDEYSDLDFFVICKEGTKERFLEHFDWLEEQGPIAYRFKNTEDGCKLLYQDGIFCEYAVFEPQRLQEIAYTGGRVVWKSDDYTISECSLPSEGQGHKAPDTEWLIGEALTNLYVGLCRYHRGEQLCAHAFIERFAVDRVLDLIALIEKPQAITEDRFMIHRRFEFRYKQHAPILSQCIAGYNNLPQSAEAILNFLDREFSINAAMKQKIQQLCHVRKGEQ